jgi:hypothetical protein
MNAAVATPSPSGSPGLEVNAFVTDGVGPVDKFL